MDKLEKIKKEIERLKEELRKPNSAAYSGSYIIGANSTLNTISDFLDTLEEESVSDRFAFKSIPRLLEMIEPTDRAKTYTAKLVDALEAEGYPTDAKIVRERLKIMNGEKVSMATMDEESVSEELEVAAKKYGTKKHPVTKIGANESAYDFKAGANWQKAKDQETIELAEDHAMLAGMNKMEEQMTKGAIDMVVGYWMPNGLSLNVDETENIYNINDGDKVKVIILKDK